MKKILIVNNDFYISENALQFAIEIAVKQNSTLFGLFLTSRKKEHSKGFISPGDIGLPDFDFTKTANAEKNAAHERERIQLFSDLCSAAGIDFKVHTISNHFLEALIDQSAFADVIICDANASPSQYSVTNLVANAHCPVILINEDYKKVENLIFTYDDKSSSIHAVKYFTYLFKFYNHLPVHFVSVLPHNIIGIEYEELIREWLPLHYVNAKIEILKGETRKELASFINSQQNPLVVMGAFGRSSLSRFFKESLANSILEKTHAPIFITHD